METKNPNVAGEMAQLLINNQTKYVPHYKGEILMPIPLHEDQLFEERARNVQWTYRIGETEMDRLQGMPTEFADWHAKVNLYQIGNSIFIITYFNRLM